MSTEDQTLTQIEVDELLALYEEYAKHEIETLKVKSKSFKQLRAKALNDWGMLALAKEKVDKELEAIQQKSQSMAKQLEAYRTSVNLYSREISSFRGKIKQLEADITPPPQPIKIEAPPPKKEEEKDEEISDDFIQRGTGIDISDSEPDHGFNDIKKNIQLFHDINNAWNEQIRSDPELSELLGIEGYESFNYTSITAKKP